jgi:hypothetical protein
VDFRVGDLVITTDCIADMDATRAGRHRRDDAEDVEALALVLRTWNSTPRPRYKLSPDEFEVCYCSGPCTGDVVRETIHNFKLVSKGNG